MDKLIVIDAQENVRVPFLRGILTRSLQDAGLAFDDAYRVASTVRDELRDEGEISNDDLREQVVRHLDTYGDAVVQRYQTRGSASGTTMVRFPGGQLEPYSRGRNRLALESCGFTGEQALGIANHTSAHLQSQGTAEIELATLRRATYDLIDQELGADAARQYLVWQEFEHSGRPILVLIGGMAGTGKSTVAANLGHLLEIARTQSTDMLREVMRVMVPERLLPVLHTSSFKAWEKLPGKHAAENSADLLVDGFLSQSELLSVACEGVIQRATQERVPLILEGAHIHPAFMERICRESDMIVVPVMLAVLKPTQLRHRIKGRGKHTGRRAKRYLDHFNQIWQLQSFLLAEADRTSIPIVANDEREHTVHQVMQVIQDELAKRFAGKPDAVLD